MIRNFPSSGGAGAAATLKQTSKEIRKGTDEHFMRIRSLNW